MHSKHTFLRCGLILAKGQLLLFSRGPGSRAQALCEG